jgi:DHA1 family multidrug resistance protein-like MFS transporter
VTKSEGDAQGTLKIGVGGAFRNLTSMDVASAALIVQFLVSVAFNLMSSFQPLFISSALGYTLIEATSWTGVSQLAASSLMALTAPFWGWMCDRVGTKKILIMVIVGNTVVYSGMAMSSNVIQIVLFRGLQGCFGGISTVMFTLIAEVVHPTELKRALSYQMAAMTIGGLIAPGIGGVLASIIGFRLTLVTSAALFVCIIPVVAVLSMPPPEAKGATSRHFTVADFKSILPDASALILIYICISFISPTVSWFLQSLGVPDEQLLLYTTAATVLNGLAYAIATPTLTRVITDRTLPLLSTAAAAIIMATAFAVSPIQFIALRVATGAVQAGIPPNLLGGKSGRKGAGMGFLNSARFMGMAIGPYMATAILGTGEPPRPFYMFTVMALMSLVSSAVIYMTHRHPKVAVTQTT